MSARDTLYATVRTLKEDTALCTVVASEAIEIHAQHEQINAHIEKKKIVNMPSKHAHYRQESPW